MNIETGFITPSGKSIPWIIYGTAWKKERTADLVVKAVKAGFRGVDTACQPRHYNEAQTGEALQQLERDGFSRKNLYLQTKFTPIGGHDPASIPYDAHASVTAQVMQSFQKSLQNLQTEYIDTLILHSPLPHYDMTIEAWEAMESIAQAGGVHQLGMSNVYDSSLLVKMYDDITIKPTILQNRFYQETGYDKVLREFCSKKGIFYEAFWTLTANPHVIASESFQAIAAKHEVTEAQVFFRFLNQSGIIILTGTCDGNHMREDLTIHEFELTVEEMRRIRLLLGIE